MMDGGFGNPVTAINSIPLRKTGGSRSTNRSDEDPWVKPVQVRPAEGSEDDPWVKPTRPKQPSGSGEKKRKIYMA